MAQWTRYDVSDIATQNKHATIEEMLEEMFPYGLTRGCVATCRPQLQSVNADGLWEAGMSSESQREVSNGW
jgi:hypothetical protein